ncbi:MULTISPECIES: hypothetical protein [Hyphobacterium]|uniref:Uncharacterized protein n=1 Tax=Hyphobacterium vulgare TaxID=1736751 RepID=A0ABV6ZTL0_9PROT
MTTYPSAYDIICESGLTQDRIDDIEDRFNKSFDELEGDCWCPAGAIRGAFHVARPCSPPTERTEDHYKCGPCALIFSVSDKTLVIAGRQ